MASHFALCFLHSCIVVFASRCPVLLSLPPLPLPYSLDGFILLFPFFFLLFFFVFAPVRIVVVWFFKLLFFLASFGVHHRVFACVFEWPALRVHCVCIVCASPPFFAVFTGMQCAVCCFFCWHITNTTPRLIYFSSGGHGLVLFEVLGYSSSHLFL